MNTEKTTCCLCHTTIESPTPAILTHGGFGHPRCLCPNCEDLLDTALQGCSAQQVRDALRTLADGRIRNDGYDRATEEALSQIMEQGVARMKALEEGTCPVAEMPSAPSEDVTVVSEQVAGDETNLYDIPEELRESEEDRELDRVEQEREAIFDKYFRWIWLGVIIAFLGALIYLLFFR